MIEKHRHGSTGRESSKGGARPSGRYIDTYLSGQNSCSSGTRPLVRGRQRAVPCARRFRRQAVGGARAHRLRLCSLPGAQAACHHSCRATIPPQVTCHHPCAGDVRAARRPGPWCAPPALVAPSDQRGRRGGRQRRRQHNVRAAARDAAPRRIASGGRIRRLGAWLRRAAARPRLLPQPAAEPAAAALATRPTAPAAAAAAAPAAPVFARQWAGGCERRTRWRGEAAPSGCACR